MKIHFEHTVGKYDPLVLNYPITFVPGSAAAVRRCACFHFFPIIISDVLMKVFQHVKFSKYLKYIRDSM